MLRAAQTLRFIGAIGRGDCAIGPGQPALRWFVYRPLNWRSDGKQPRLAFDHNVSGVGCSRRNQRDPFFPCFNPSPYRLGAAARFTKSSASQKQPRPPISRRRELFLPGPTSPAMLECVEFSFIEALEERYSLVWRQRCEPLCGQHSSARRPRSRCPCVREQLSLSTQRASSAKKSLTSLGRARL